MTKQTTRQRKITKNKNDEFVELDDDKLIVSLAGKAENLRDEMNLDIDNLKRWFMNIIKQTRYNYKKKDYCWVCDSKPGINLLESNHIAGKKHDYRLNTMCIPCHQEFSEIQLTWGTQWYRKDQPEKMRRMFLYMGIRDILVLKSKKTGNSIYEKFSRKLNSVIFTLIQENEYIQRENSN